MFRKVRNWLTAPGLGITLVSLSFVGCQDGATKVAKIDTAAQPEAVQNDAAVASETGNSKSPTGATNEPQIPPSALTEDGLVVLESGEPSDVPPGRAPDIIFEKPEIPKDAKFGTPTLAEPIAENLPPEPVVTEPVVTAEPAPESQEPTASSTEGLALTPSVEGAATPDAQPAKGDLKPLPKATGIGNLATDEELRQKIAEDWPKPQAVFVLTGQQHGYIEPCGCTGLDRQKGGLIRRDTLIKQLSERGWDVVPLDVGNQVRRTGRQPVLQFQSTVKAFELMGYKAVALGSDDLRLGSDDLLQIAGTDNEFRPREYISANASVVDPGFWPKSHVITVGDRKIGVTAYLSPELGKDLPKSVVTIDDPVPILKTLVQDLKSKGCDYLVLLAHASQEDSEKMAVAVPGFDLVVTAGGAGEPRNVLDPIPGSDALISQVGTKGMFACIVGLFDDKDQPVRYQRIALSAQFPDSPRMLDLFKQYQDQLKSAGFEGLGLKPTPHPSGREFVGSESCGDCHTTAFDIWKESPHFHATDSIVTPPNDRGAIPRHFDPECVSCHVTGWDAQKFTPFATGYWSLDQTPNLLGSGCENCHGPGSEHVKAENGDIEADDALLAQLREQMKLPLAHARDTCVKCHDLDNSPDFHASEDAFDHYWERVKHYGKD